MHSADTDPATERVQVALLRNATVARRAALARSLSCTTLQLTRRAIQRAHPTADATQVLVELIRACYGGLLADKVRSDVQVPTAMNPTPPDAVAAITPIVDTLDQLGVRYHVGGSLASSAYGVPRATADVDLVADLRLEQVDPFVSQLEPEYYVDREGAREAVRRRQSFNLIHSNTMIKVDVFVPEARPFDRSEQSRALPQTLDVSENARTFFVKSPKDLVLRKLSWYRAGDGVSEQQWSDVLGILKVQADQLDRDYLDRWAAELDLHHLLERALADANES